MKILPDNSWPRRYFVVIPVVMGLLCLLLYTHRRHTTPSRRLPKHNTDFWWSRRPIEFDPDIVQDLPAARPMRLPQIQYAFRRWTMAEEGVNHHRRQEVKATFVRCWESYKKYAWMEDELAPISGSPRASLGGWAASLVDSLDTLFIMELTRDFEEAVQACTTINFNSSQEETINVFETTIRYLGGLLGAYDLSGNSLLLEKAVEVGQLLLVAFDTPNRMPITRWNVTFAKGGGSQVAPDAVLVAEIGSLSLEFTRLSQLTGDPIWFDAIERITQMFLSQQDLTKLPGLFPMVIDPRREKLTTGDHFTMGGMSDSVYEYLPKMFALTGGLLPHYRNLYEDSIRTAQTRLFFRPMVPGNRNILVSGNVVVTEGGVEHEPQGQHLGCFIGGMLALGGKLFSRPDHIDMAQRMVHGCIWAYQAVPIGIMPETFHLLPCPQQSSCEWDTDSYANATMERSSFKHEGADLQELTAAERLPLGFTAIGDPRYLLRPEAIEAVFYLYRTTGDPSLQDKAWEMFTSVRRMTETHLANTAISDVTMIDSKTGLPPREDRMESFWLAETLKYFYLIFCEPSVISLDEWVLNTEAHPFRLPT